MIWLHKTNLANDSVLHWVVRRQLNAVRALARLCSQTHNFKKGIS